MILKNIYKKARIFILTKFKYKFVTVGSGFYCGKGLYIDKKTVSVGNMVYLGNYCHLAAGDIKIDDFVMLASSVAIVGGDHYYDKVGVPMTVAERGIQKGVIIEKDVWVGHGTIILQGVTLGEGCVIGAGSIVTKSVSPYSIVVGNPLKFIRNRFETIDERVAHSKAIDGKFYKNI